MFISSYLIMPRNRELDDAAMRLLGVHHHASWLCRKVIMRRWVKLRKKTRDERKLEQLRTLHIKYTTKQTKQFKKQIKQLEKQIKQLEKEIKSEKFKIYCFEEQAFENLITENRKAVTAPAWVSANKKAQSRL
jgi:septal ring factor EnvC (AmiA/AmiB activator)